MLLACPCLCLLLSCCSMSSSWCPFAVLLLVVLLLVASLLPFACLPLLDFLAALCLFTSFGPPCCPLLVYLFWTMPLDRKFSNEALLSTCLCLSRSVLLPGAVWGWSSETPPSTADPRTRQAPTAESETLPGKVVPTFRGDPQIGRGLDYTFSAFGYDQV